tara:strand:- start:180 stop:902 length:723 start_codon:yes stop_codon:yes gene_type:complete
MFLNMYKTQTYTMTEELNHVGIIMDGNRRFSKKLMKKPWMGHKWGARKLEEVMEWLQEMGIKEATFYCLSLENFNRPKLEFNYLMKLFDEELETSFNDERIVKNQIRMKFIGRTDLLPQSIQEKIKRIENKTKDHKKFFANFAMAYSGRAEIIDAIKKIAKKGLTPDQINEESFQKELYIDSQPDLVIRTSGEKRTSGFMLWQSSYAELYFSSKLWPEFEKEDLKKAIDEYKDRDRRFGK